MAKNNKRNPQSGGNSTQNSNQNRRQEREQKQQQWVDDSVNKIRSGGYGIIQQKTRDTAETRNFINIIDNLMYTVRMNAGIAKNIPAEALTQYISRVQRAKDELNLVAAEMCRDMGRQYHPPRGYKNPLAKQQAPVAKQQKEKKQAAPQVAHVAAPQATPFEAASPIAPELSAEPVAAAVA